jgi:hypothetical protein
VSTLTFYSLSTICQYLTHYSLLVLFHCVHCCLLQSVHCLSELHTEPPVGFVPLCTMLSTTVCPLSLSTSHRTATLFYINTSNAVFYTLSNYTVSSVGFCVTASTANFYRISTACQHLSNCTVCWFCVALSTSTFYSLYTAITSHCTVCWFCVNMSTACQYLSHCTVCCFCVTMSTAVFYNLSTVCQYLTLYRLLLLCHYVHCCLLQSVYHLSVSHNITPLGSVSLCPVLPSKICPLSVSTSH